MRADAPSRRPRRKIQHPSSGYDTTTVQRDPYPDGLIDSTDLTPTEDRHDS